MKPASAKAKGKKLEHHVASRLRIVDPEAKVMPMSGAITGFRGDIYTQLPIHLELKNQERVRLWEFWEQATSQAGLGKMPILVISRNFCKDPIAVLRFEDLLTFFELALKSGWVSYIRTGRRTKK